MRFHGSAQLAHLARQAAQLAVYLAVKLSAHVWPGETLRKKREKKHLAGARLAAAAKTKKGLQPDVRERAAELAAWLAY
jgi:hypothetical protein